MVQEGIRFNLISGMTLPFWINNCIDQKYLLFGSGETLIQIRLFGYISYFKELNLKNMVSIKGTTQGEPIKYIFSEAFAVAEK